MKHTFPHNVAFGRALRQIRQQRQLTQEQLSFESGVARVHISRLELGEMSPSLDTIMSLCHALSISLSDLIGLVEQAMKEVESDD